MTVEAIILHHADDTSAKAASMADALADESAFDAGDPVSTKTFWQLDKARAWRPVADWGRGD